MSLLEVTQALIVACKGVGADGVPMRPLPLPDTPPTASSPYADPESYYGRPIAPR